MLSQHHRPSSSWTAKGAVVRAPRGPLIGILTSLLDNALAHGGGEVQVRVAIDGDDATLTVRDAGPGSCRLAADVFQRSVSGSQGTGIGLALARSLALGEGGSLEVATASAAELTLRLPLTYVDVDIAGAQG